MKMEEEKLLLLEEHNIQKIKTLFYKLFYLYIYIFFSYVKKIIILYYSLSEKFLYLETLIQLDKYFSIFLSLIFIEFNFN